MLMSYKGSHTSVEVSLENSVISYRISLIIAVVCICTYVAALAMGGWRIFRMMEEQRVLAAEEFDDLVTYTTAEGKHNGFMTESFQENVKGALVSSHTLQAAILTNASSEYVFERAPDTGITWSGGTPSFKSSLWLSSSPFFAPLALEDQRNTTLRAVYNIVDFGALITILKQALVIVIAGLCVSCITLLLRVLLVRDKVPVDLAARKRRDSDLFNKEEDISSSDDESFSDLFDTEDIDNMSADDGVSIDADPLEADSEDTADDPIFLDNGFLEEPPSADSDNSAFSDDNAPAESPQDRDMPLMTDISEDEFAGLFPKEDETSYTQFGLNWEADTFEKLSEELHKSETFYQSDLAVIAAEVDIDEDEDPEAQVFPALAAYAVDFFVMRELIFQRGDKGFIAIVEDTDIDAAFEKAAKFRSEFLSKHPEFPRDLKLFAGISSRCGREVDAERLIREASAALSKAEDGSPIVAFRVDPEKYKEFIRNQNAAAEAAPDAI